MHRDESYSIARREMLRMIGVAALSATTAAAADDDLPRFSALDHLEFFVSDIQKSVAFYAKIFGNTILKNNNTSRRYQQLGSAYMAIDQGQQIRVDHVCAGVPGFQVATAHSFLEKRGIAYRDYPSGRDLSVADPDGSRLQLAGSNGWTQLPATTPEAGLVSEGPIFQPLSLDHVLLNVSDPEKSTSFYEKILGPVTQRSNNRIWFQVGLSRLGLLQTPNGQRAGVNHFCVSAAAFNYDAVLKRLEQAGAKLEASEGTGSPQFRDPDGYLVQVLGPR